MDFDPFAVAATCHFFVLVALTFSSDVWRNRAISDSSPTFRRRILKSISLSCPGPPNITALSGFPIREVARRNFPVPTMQWVHRVLLRASTVVTVPRVAVPSDVSA